jgi:hypothetical protein
VVAARAPIPAAQQFWCDTQKRAGILSSTGLTAGSVERETLMLPALASLL